MGLLLESVPICLVSRLNAKMTHVIVCRCTCAGAARVHIVPLRHVDIKVQVWSPTGLRNQVYGHIITLLPFSEPCISAM